MNLGYFLGQLIIISCAPLVSYALTKSITLKEVRRTKRHFWMVFTILSLLVLIGSELGTESILAVFTSAFIYIFTYKRLVKNKYEPRIVDFESIDDYIAALAKKRNLTYPLSQNILLIYGPTPKMEDFESIHSWSNALKKFLDDIAST